MTSFGTVKKLGPGHYLVVHKTKVNQHHSGTPCGYCGTGRRSDARGLLCSRCRQYSAPKKWEEKQRRL
jgi:tRNA(Ile2) C34 agmatinyltransferase TiaS